MVLQPAVSKSLFKFMIVQATEFLKGLSVKSSLMRSVFSGPRFVLEPMHILEGAFGGKMLWRNENYVSPQALNAQMREQKKMKHLNSKMQKKQRQVTHYVKDFAVY